MARVCLALVKVRSRALHRLDPGAVDRDQLTSEQIKLVLP